MQLVTDEKITALLKANGSIIDGQIYSAISYFGHIEFEMKFKNVTFTEGVILTDITSDKEVRFEDCTFQKGVRFIGGKLDYVRFMNCNFESFFTVEGTLFRSIAVVNCTFSVQCEFENITAENLIVEGITVMKGRMAFTKCNGHTWMISDLREHSELTITSFDFEKMGYVDCSISVLSYSGSSHFKGWLLVAGMNVQTLSLSGDNIGGRLSFQEIDLTELYFQRFLNSGLLSFSNIRPELSSKIDCYSANLGKCELYAIDFRGFESISIQNSSIQEIIPTYVIWCKKATLDDKNSSVPNNREVYRQLKNVMIRQNDKVQELIYHRHEMDALLLDLSKNPGNWSDRFIIWTNKVSNAHGLSWRRALLLLIVISIIVFVTNKILLGYTYFDRREIFKNVGLFLESMNPIRKFSAVYDEPHTGTLAGLAYAIDVIYRFIASYLIFQFISAFRKFVKK